MWLLSGLALALDASAYQQVLDRHLGPSGFDYAGLHAAPATLDGYLAALRDAPLAGLARAERTATWINAYNALTLDLVAEAWPLASIRDLDGGKVWDTRRFRVGGQELSLNQLEGLLRAEGDPRIHGALNCASRGCPPLSPTVYAGPTLEPQLAEAGRRLAATARVEGGVLYASHVFEWYGEDFVPAWGTARADLPRLSGRDEAVANFVAAHAPALASAVRGQVTRVDWLPYDWAVNVGGPTGAAPR